MKHTRGSCGTFAHEYDERLVFGNDLQDVAEDVLLDKPAIMAHILRIIVHFKKHYLDV